MGKKFGPNPTDRGKGWVKRSLLTEAHGIPLAVVIDGTNGHDMKLLKPTITDLKLNRPRPTSALPKGLRLDKGYDYDEVRTLVAEFGFTAHIRARGEETIAIKQEAGFCARRWVVERTQLDEPIPPRSNSLGKAGKNLSRISSFGVRCYYLARNRPTGIGS